MQCSATWPPPWGRLATRADQSGHPRCPGDARQRPSPLMDRDLYGDHSPLPGKRHQMGLGALPPACRVGSLLGSLLLAGCKPPPNTPKIIVVVASATANGPTPVLAAQDRAYCGARTTRVPGAPLRREPEHRAGPRGLAHPTPGQWRGRLRPGPHCKLNASMNKVQRLLSTLAASKHLIFSA